MNPIKRAILEKLQESEIDFSVPPKEFNGGTYIPHKNIHGEEVYVWVNKDGKMWNPNTKSHIEQRPSYDQGDSDAHKRYNYSPRTKIYIYDPVWSVKWKRPAHEEIWVTPEGSDVVGIKMSKECVDEYGDGYSEGVATR